MNNKEKILKVLFENSQREYHIRLLAKLTGLNPNTIINLTNDDFIFKKKDEDTNRVIIKAITDNIDFKLQKKFYNIRKIYDSGLIKFLNDELSFPTVVLFGSYAKADNHPKSDIDIFIIADEKKELSLKKFEKILQTEIQIFMHTKKELKKLNAELINNVINGYVMSGFLEVL